MQILFPNLVFLGDVEDKLRIMFELCDDDNEGTVDIEHFKVRQRESVRKKQVYISEDSLS